MTGGGRFRMLLIAQRQYPREVATGEVRSQDEKTDSRIAGKLRATGRSTQLALPGPFVGSQRISRLRSQSTHQSRNRRRDQTAEGDHLPPKSGLPSPRVPITRPQRRHLMFLALENLFGYQCTYPMLSITLPCRNRLPRQTAVRLTPSLSRNRKLRLADGLGCSGPDRC